jgi:hypothetical protein
MCQEHKILQNRGAILVRNKTIAGTWTSTGTVLILKLNNQAPSGSHISPTCLSTCVYLRIGYGEIRVSENCDNGCLYNGILNLNITVRGKCYWNW